MYYVLTRIVRPASASDNPVLFHTLLALACVSAVSSFAVKKWYAVRAQSEDKPAFRRTGYLLSLVLCEAAALYGVVVWFVTASPHSYVFMLIGGIAMLLHFPTRTGRTPTL